MAVARDTGGATARVRIPPPPTGSPARMFVCTYVHIPFPLCARSFHADHGVLLVLCLQVKDVIQAHTGDLSDTEAECARIGAEADAEERLSQEAPAGSGRGKGKRSEDAVLAELQKQLQSTGQQVLQLQQKMMQPQTPAEVFGTFVKGTLLNLSERKFKKARMGISRILEAVTQDSDEEEPPHVAPPSYWPGGRAEPTYASTLSSTPKSAHRWHGAPQLWDSTRPVIGSHRRFQDRGDMEMCQASMTSQMRYPPSGSLQLPYQQQQHSQQQDQQRHGPFQFPQQQRQYSEQQQQQQQQQPSVSTVISDALQVLAPSEDTGAVGTNEEDGERGRAHVSLPHVSGISSLFDTSGASGQGSSKEANAPLDLVLGSSGETGAHE